MSAGSIKKYKMGCIIVIFLVCYWGNLLFTTTSVGAVTLVVFHAFFAIAMT